MRILDRYLLRQMVVPFLIGVAVFLVILLGDEARKLGAAVTGLRVPLVVILKYLLYASPGALVWSLPVGTLLGVSMAATLAARGGETTAMRVGGVSFLRVSVPYLLVGLVMSLLAFSANELVVPSSTRWQRAAFEEMTQTQPVVREAFDQYFRDDRGRIFYVGHMDAENNRLERVMVWTLGPDGSLREIESAQRAVLKDRVWSLEDGATAYLDAQGVPVRVQRYAHKPILLSRALQNYYAEKRTPLEMSANELVALATALEETGQESQRLRVHLAFKYSIPAACLVLALIAVPLADRFASLGSFAGLVVAIALVFLYNGVRSWGLALGLAGVLPPLVAGWAQNVIFGGLGLALLVRHR